MSEAETKHYLRPTSFCPPTASSRRRQWRSPAAPGRMSTRRARSMNGSWRIHTGTRRRAAAASATSDSCWSPGIWVASAPISTRFMLDWRARPGLAGARRVWHPRRQVGDGVQEPRHLSENVTKAQHCRAEVYLERIWLGSCRSRGRAESHAGGTAGKSAARRRDGEKGPRAAVRIVGDELDGVQLRARCRAAGIERRSRSGSCMYPQAETAEWPARLPRSGQFQVRDYFQRDYARPRLTPRLVARQGMPLRRRRLRR